MDTYRWDYAVSNDDVIKKASDQLLKGNVGVIPTDTVYGLVGVFGKSGVFQRLCEIKKRPVHKKFVLQVSDYPFAKTLCRGLSQKAKQLMQHFWPGAITFICNSSVYLQETYHYNEKTVAIRIPNHAIMSCILHATQLPLIVTSANISGEEIPSTIDTIKYFFEKHIDFVIDDELEYGLVPSTILDITGSDVNVVREGIITKDEISKAYTMKK